MPLGWGSREDVDLFDRRFAEQLCGAVVPIRDRGDDDTLTARALRTLCTGAGRTGADRQARSISSSRSSIACSATSLSAGWIQI